MSDASPSIDLDGLTAAEIDALMRRLVARRATMKPVHPALPPEDPDAMHHADNMLWNVRPAPGRSVLELSLYHPGLGWVGMVMSRAQIEDLEDAIAFTIRDLPDIPYTATTSPALG